MKRYLIENLNWYYLLIFFCLVMIECNINKVDCHFYNKKEKTTLNAVKTSAVEHTEIQDFPIWQNIITTIIAGAG